MVFFAIFLTQNLIQIYTKTQQIEHLKKISRWGMPPNPLAKRGASRRTIHPASGMYIYFTTIVSPHV